MISHAHRAWDGPKARTRLFSLSKGLKTMKLSTGSVWKCNACGRLHAFTSPSGPRVFACACGSSWITCVAKGQERRKRRKRAA